MPKHAPRAFAPAKCSLPQVHMFTHWTVQPSELDHTMSGQVAANHVFNTHDKGGSLRTAVEAGVTLSGSTPGAAAPLQHRPPPSQLAPLRCSMC